LQDFEQCALACAVATDDADDFAPFNLEVDILKRLKFFDDFAFKNLPPSSALRAKFRLALPMASRSSAPGSPNL
jgi:hypothetical protein